MDLQFSNALVVGSLVTLKRNFCTVGDAAIGCLRPEEGCNQGRVVSISEPGRCRLGTRHRRWDRVTGYGVVRLDGEGPWLYAREALCPVGSSEAAPLDLPMGASVVLARGHVWLPCAAFGPLRPGCFGTIIGWSCTEKMPYQVLTSRGSAWYTRQAICRLGSPEAADDIPQRSAVCRSTPLSEKRPRQLVITQPYFPAYMFYAV